MTTPRKKTLKQHWTDLGDVAKAATAIVAFFLLVIPLIIIGVDRYVDQKISDRTHELVNKRCVRIPSSGHHIVGAPPGGQARVFFVGVQRLRDDCGMPRLTGVVSNGDRILHRAILGIDGVDLPVGTHNLSYTFDLGDNFKPGQAVFQLRVSFPDAPNGSESVESVAVPFRIYRPDEPLPTSAAEPSIIPVGGRKSLDFLRNGPDNGRED